MVILGHIELFVSDAEASKRFYRDVLGFTIVAEQGAFTWFDVKQGQLLLRPGGARRNGASMRQSGRDIVLYTDDPAATAEQWRGRGLAIRFDESEDCFLFQDPDGHWFQLVNPQAHR